MLSQTSVSLSLPATFQGAQQPHLTEEETEGQGTPQSHSACEGAWLCGLSNPSIPAPFPPAAQGRRTWCFFSVSSRRRECRELSASRKVARRARSISALWYAPATFPHRNKTAFAASCGSWSTSEGARPGLGWGEDAYVRNWSWSPKRLGEDIYLRNLSISRQLVPHCEFRRGFSFPPFSLLQILGSCTISAS